MSDSEQLYFGYRYHDIEKQRMPNSFRVSTTLDDFRKSDSEEILAEPSDDLNIPSACDGFKEIEWSFYETMTGFIEVMNTAGLTYSVMKSVEIESFLRREVEPLKSNEIDVGHWKVAELPINSLPRVSRHAVHLSKKIKQIPLINNVFLLGLVSQFDAFFGRLIRELAISKPHIIFESEKNYTAADVLSFPSLNEFQESVLEKEVETVLRGSHEDQFKWLEGKIKKPLRNDLAVWPVFIELCERRNLFAHSEGRVSATYLKKCGEAGASQKFAVGDQLDASPEYLRQAAFTLLEIGIKLSQVLWRISGNDAFTHSAADSHLNEIGFDLIYHGYPESAKSLLEFGFSKPMKHPRKMILHMMRINLANAHKLLEDTEAAHAILDEEDWSPMQPQFQLCVAAVRDDLDGVRRAMEQTPETEVGVLQYIDWPVFSGLVDKVDYLDLLRDLFGKQVVQSLLREVVEASEDFVSETSNAD